ncbi:hypothetical protein HDU87_004541 [Geranomyces variabilis]|uniref:Uncharacterized protein n=1 Tax=Geranomyces variabilis TaxID=109894 RepID=A0AAD5XRU7_9FUNG|nr:hypothetical protein HDU87_004541 [Geranomyces variabilis]
MHVPKPPSSFLALLLLAVLALGLGSSAEPLDIVTSDPPALVLTSGRFMSEAAFNAFAQEIQADYNLIPSPSPQVTQAVNDVTSTAGHGPVDLAAVDYLAKRLESVLPNDPTYAPLADAANQLSAAVNAANKNLPIPVPTPFKTVTFGMPAPTTAAPLPPGSTVLQTQWSTVVSGTLTVTVPFTTVTTTVAVTTTPVGGKPIPTASTSAGIGSGSCSACPAPHPSTPSFGLPFVPADQVAGGGPQGLNAIGASALVACAAAAGLAGLLLG